MGTLLSRREEDAMRTPTIIVAVVLISAAVAFDADGILFEDAGSSSYPTEKLADKAAEGSWEEELIEMWNDHHKKHDKKHAKESHKHEKKAHHDKKAHHGKTHHKAAKVTHAKKKAAHANKKAKKAAKKTAKKEAKKAAKKQMKKEVKKF